MDFLRRNINKTQRNGDIYIASHITSYSSYGGNGGSSSGGNYLPATNNGDGTYTVDLTSVLFNGNVIAQGEVAAYLSGNTDASGSTTVGNVTIEDNLTSTATTAALSANQGRILKGLIDEVSGKTSGVTSGETVTEVSALTEHINDKVIHISETDRTNWNNKLNKSVWDDVFEVDSNGNLKVKVNLYGDKEISAYGSGSTSSGDNTEIILDNYYTKDEVNDLIDNIECTGGTGNVDLSEYSKTSHTHSNYTLATTFNNHASNTTLHITAEERTKWNDAVTSSHTHSNKSVLDGISSTKVNNWDGVVSDWNDVFEINSDGSLKVKVNLYGDGEISAYGSGSSESIDGALDNYYTKSEVDDLIDNIDVSGVDVDLSEYSKTSHTHSNYALSNHSHSNYALSSHTHSQYASSSHTHSISNITNLQSTLDGKSGTGHSHNDYATTTNFNSHSGNTTAHITAAERTNWDNAVTSSHTHNNKTVLDGITASKVSNWDDVYNDFNSVFTINSNGDLQVKVNVIGEGEISAYGSGSSTSNGAITIVDNLTSTATTAALSANQGRILKGLIDNVDIDLSDYYNKDEVDELIANADVDIDLSEYSKTSHTHSNYSLTSHTHNEYASSSHTHPISAITSLQSTLDGKSGTGHSHSNYSLTSHTHSQYASSSHTHSISNITNLQSTLDGKSSTGHSHSNYSVTSHTHNYAGSSSSGGAATSANKVNSTLSWSGYASGSFNGSSAASFTIPSNTNQLTNGAGFITSGATVAAANKLATSRTLWGQSFNGTANVSGNMTGVGSISASGNITTTAEVTAHSDIRLKSNIKPLDNKGYVQPYRYIKDGKESIGFIAQEMQELYPQLVTVDESTEEKYLTVNYMQYTAVLQAQIIELSREIQELKDKLNDIYNKE